MFLSNFHNFHRVLHTLEITNGPLYRSKQSPLFDEVYCFVRPSTDMVRTRTLWCLEPCTVYIVNAVQSLVPGGCPTRWQWNAGPFSNSLSGNVAKSLDRRMYEQCGMQTVRTPNCTDCAERSRTSKKSNDISERCRDRRIVKLLQVVACKL